MKKIVLFVALSLIAGQVFAQQGTGVETNSNVSAAVALSGSDGTNIWYGFVGYGGGDAGFKTSAINPKDKVFNTGDFSLMGKLTLTSGSEASDSLHAYALPLGPDGFVMSEDTLWFDWDDHTTRITETTAGSGYLDWAAFDGTLGVTGYTFWINLTNKYPPCHGLKFFFDVNDAGNMVASLVLIASEVR